MSFVIAAEPEETNPLEDDDQLVNPLELEPVNLVHPVKTEPVEDLQSAEGNFYILNISLPGNHSHYKTTIFRTRLLHKLEQ